MNEKEKIVEKLEFEVPIPQSIKWTIGEKIFLYSLIVPAEKYLCYYKNFWFSIDRFYEGHDEVIKENQNSTFLIEKFLRDFQAKFQLDQRLATMAYDFWHDILFEELIRIDKMAKKRLKNIVRQ